MAFDSDRGKSVLFGGLGGTGLLSDTWEWDGRDWRSVSSTFAPPGREQHAMAFSGDTEVVLHGGFDGHRLLDDLWCWDGSAWNNLSSLRAPRRDHAMVYDAESREFVIFGGFGPAGLLGDTLVVDPAGQAHSLGIPGPLPREQHAMVYDERHRRVILFGGSRPSGRMGDTWALHVDGVSSAWTQLPIVGPTARANHAMAYDSNRQSTVLFGGSTLFGYLADTWVLPSRGFDSLPSGVWTRVVVAGPPARQQAAFVVAEVNNTRIVALFGGDDGGLLGDTWHWRGYTNATTTTYGAGCGNPELRTGAATGNSGLPILGTTVRATFSNLPSAGLVWVGLGWNNTTYGGVMLPMALDPYGMPGCHLRQSLDLLDSSSRSGYDLRILPELSLLGRTLHLQALAQASGANQANLITSNGLRWVIGL